MVGLAPAKVRVHWELCLVCGRRRLLQHGIKARATMLMLYYCFLNSLLLDPNRHAFLVFLLPASGHYWNKLACHKTEPFSALLAWPSTSPPSTEFALNFCCCLHPWAKAKRKASMRGLLLLFLHITSKQTKGQKGFQNFFFPIWTEDFGKSWHLESLTAEEMEKVELIKNFCKSERMRTCPASRTLCSSGGFKTQTSPTHMKVLSNFELWSFRCEWRRAQKIWQWLRAKMQQWQSWRRRLGKAIKT